jgi:hypothetical protein
MSTAEEGGPWSPPEPHEGDSADDADDAEEHELFVSGATVVVSAPGSNEQATGRPTTSSRSLTVEGGRAAGKIRCALWTHFWTHHQQRHQQHPRHQHADEPHLPVHHDGARRERALVLICEDLAHFYFEGGQHLLANLPFRVRRAWALDVGLLLERERSPEEMLGLQLPPDPVAPARLPTFFSLMHPLEEVKIVSRLLTSQHPGGSDLFYDFDFATPCAEVEESLVCVGRGDKGSAGSDASSTSSLSSAHPTLLITHHAGTLEHRVYDLVRENHDTGKPQRKGAAYGNSCRSSSSSSGNGAPFPKRPSTHPLPSKARQDPVLCGMDVESTTSLLSIQGRQMKSVLYLKWVATMPGG